MSCRFFAALKWIYLSRKQDNSFEIAYRTSLPHLVVCKIMFDLGISIQISFGFRGDPSIRPYDSPAKFGI